MALRTFKSALGRVSAHKAQVMEVAGLVALASGAGLIWLPLGLIVSGIGLLLMAWGSSTT